MNNFSRIFSKDGEGVPVPGLHKVKPKMCLQENLVDYVDCAPVTWTLTGTELGKIVKLITMTEKKTIGITVVLE